VVIAWNYDIGFLGKFELVPYLADYGFKFNGLIGPGDVFESKCGFEYDPIPVLMLEVMVALLELL